jgi:hypothetical protein
MTEEDRLRDALDSALDKAVLALANIYRHDGEAGLRKVLKNIDREDLRLLAKELEEFGLPQLAGITVSVAPDGDFEVFN